MMGVGAARAGSVQNPVTGTLPTLEIYGPTLSGGYTLPGTTQVSAHVALTTLGDATAADVAKGKTFTSVAGLTVTGTKVDSGYPQSNLSNTVWTYNSSVKYKYSDIVSTSETSLYCPCQLADSNGNTYIGFTFSQGTNDVLSVSLVDSSGFPTTTMFSQGTWVGGAAVEKLTIKTTDVHPTALVFLTKYFKLKTPNEKINVYNLTNTMWLLDKDLGTFSSDTTFSLKFIAYGVSYSSLRLYSPSASANIGNDYNTVLIYGNSEIYAGSPNSWSNKQYRFVTITGGSAVTNTDLISWFKNHGTLLS
jgi:hypothetical protein